MLECWTVPTVKLRLNKSSDGRGHLRTKKGGQKGVTWWANGSGRNTERVLTGPPVCQSPANKGNCGTVWLWQLWHKGNCGIGQESTTPDHHRLQLYYEQQQQQQQRSYQKRWGRYAAVAGEYDEFSIYKSVRNRNSGGRGLCSNNSSVSGSAMNTGYLNVELSFVA